MSDQSLIFFSHAGEDKDFVNSVATHIPKSHLFIDTRTIDPGGDFKSAMDIGVEDAILFCLFVSPTALKKRWVNYEANLARLKKLRGDALEILVIPIKGASYEDAPKWMQRYLAIPSEFTPFDVARTIRGLQESTLRAAGKIAKEPFVGREEFLGQQLLRIRSQQARSGTLVNCLIISGLQRIGRRLFSFHLSRGLYPGGRSFGPVLELPPFADAIDFYFALKETRIPPDRWADFKRSFGSFGSLSAASQANLIVDELDHYGAINQQVVARSAFGLRDKTRELKGWTRELFELMRVRPSTRLIWLSERLLPDEALMPYANVAQVQLGEISQTAAANLLMEAVPERALSPLIVEDLCKRTGGHPGTIHFLAYLINEGRRSAEAILSDGKEVLAFQDQLLREMLGDLDDGIQLKIMHALAVFPSLRFDELVDIAGEGGNGVGVALGELIESGLVVDVVDTGYVVPEIVRSVFRRRFGETPRHILTAASTRFQKEFARNSVSKQTVDKLLFARVLQTGQLPAELADVVSSATLHQLVRAEYDSGSSLRGKESRTAYARAASLSQIADVIPMPYDTCEEILFWGADALVRINENPEAIVKMMRARGFASANYILGLYELHQNRDPKSAIPYLKRALEQKAFVLRTTRLLARAYLDDGQAVAALDLIEGVNPDRVRRDSGLLSQKIRALRSLNRREEADRLLVVLKALDDRYGEFELMQAHEARRKGNTTAAFDALARAELKPRANKQNIRFIRCVWQIDEGDYSELDEAISHAIAVGRTDEAIHLRTRAAFRSGKTEEADRLWREIKRPNYMDLQLRVEILQSLMSGNYVNSDSLKREWQSELDKVLAATRRVTRLG